MADDRLSEDDVELLLHEIVRQIADARFKMGVDTPRGAEALRIAMAGPYCALRMLKSDPDAP